MQKNLFSKPGVHWCSIDEDVYVDAFLNYDHVEERYINRIKGTTDLLFLKAFRQCDAAIRAHCDFLFNYLRAYGDEYRALLESWGLPRNWNSTDRINFLKIYDQACESFDTKYSFMARRVLSSLQDRFDAGVVYAAGQDGLDVDLQRVRRKYEGAVKQQLAAERDYFRMSHAILEDDADHLIQFYEENSNSSNDPAQTALQAWEEPMDILYMPPPQPRCNISTGSEPQK